MQPLPGILKDPDGSGSAEVQDYYFHQDDLFNVVLVTDSGGDAAERYEYGDYGAPFYFTGAGSSTPSSAINNTRLFNGREWDDESRFYYYRTRYLEPTMGRFTTRDTIGVWGDSANAGNGVAYVGSTPLVGIDPYGLQFDPLHSPVSPLEPAFGTHWGRGFSETGKQDMRARAQTACDRAQCALVGLSDPKAASCLNNQCKSSVPAVNHSVAKRRLREFVKSFCQGDNSPRRFHFKPTRGDDPYTKGPFGAPNSDSWQWHPTGKDGRPSKRGVPGDIIHESFHHLYDTPDDQTPTEDKQEDVDKLIGAAANCAVSSGAGGCTGRKVY